MTAQYTSYYVYIAVVNDAIIKAIIEKHTNAIISVDTFRSSVAKQAVEAGAAIVNDVSGGKM